jgi:ferredoxin
VFRLTSRGYSEVNGVIHDSDLDVVREAERRCPVGAIRISVRQRHHSQRPEADDA